MIIKLKEEIKGGYKNKPKVIIGPIWEIKWWYEVVEYGLKCYNALFPKMGIKIRDMDELGVIGYVLWKKCIIVACVSESLYIANYVIILLLWMLCCSWSMVFMVFPCDMIYVI